MARGSTTTARARRARAAAPAVVALAVGTLVLGAATACAPEGDGGAGTTVTTFERAGAASLLVRLSDLRDLGVFGFDVREQPVLDPRQFSTASLRGPCGAHISGAPLADGVLAVRRSTIALVVEVVSQPGVAAASGFVDAARIDMTPGCPAFAETVGGAPAQVRLVRAIDLPALGDDRIGWVQDVTDASGRAGQRLVVIERSGGRLVFLVVLLDRAVDPEGAVDLAVLAARAAFGGAAGPGADRPVRTVGSAPPGTAGPPGGPAPGPPAPGSVTPGSPAPGTTGPAPVTSAAPARRR